MKRVIFIFLALYITNFAFLKTKGKSIVDENGNSVLFRGIGLGGWLVPEGYMIHFTGYGSPDTIRAHIEQLIGAEDTEKFFSEYRKNYVNREDIKRISELGYNLIRLPFDYKILVSDIEPVQFKEEGFAYFDSLLQWCKDYNLYLIFDMHCAPGGQNADNISNSDGVARLWTEPDKYQPVTIEIWKEIARRYKDYPEVAGYDLLNEPVLPSGHSNKELRKLYMDITRAIRTIDTNHIVYIEGNFYATDFNYLTPPFDNNMAYSFHKYWNENSRGAISGYLEIRDKWNVPLWMSESGENSNVWFYDAKTLFEENNIGWCWWTHKKVGTITSPFSAKINSNYQKIIDYWQGKTAKPSKEVAKAGLMQLAEDLKIENCQYLPDVVASLFDSDFNKKNKPYKNVTLPGIINCAEYDIGNFGVSYYDADHIQRANYNDPGNWNYGWVFRNDGVDIDVTGDAKGFDYCIGWIGDNEWYKYTVTVSQTGSYSLKVRYAGKSDGRINILCNGYYIVKNKPLTSTGSYHNWVDKEVGNGIYLKKGTYTIKVEVIKSGFNLEQLKFDLVSTGLKQSESNSKKSQEILVFPNPFVDFYKVKFLSDKNQILDMKIYNIIGNLVFDKKLQVVNGMNEMVFDADDIDAGMYLLELQSRDLRIVKKLIKLQ